MPRRESDPRFGARVLKLRVRLGVDSQAEFARRLGLAQQTVRQWEVQNSAPSALTLKRSIKRLKVWAWKDLLSWLADGEDEPPAWLDDPTLDPHSPPPMPVTVALRRATVERLDEARLESVRAQASGEIRGDHVFNVVRILKDEAGELSAALRISGTSSSARRVA